MDLIQYLLKSIKIFYFFNVFLSHDYTKKNRYEAPY